MYVPRVLYRSRKPGGFRIVPFASTRFHVRPVCHRGWSRREACKENERDKESNTDWSSRNLRPFTGHQCMCEASSTHRRSVAKSTRNAHMNCDGPMPRRQRVSISRLRVDMTSRRGDVCSWLFDSAAAIRPGTVPACRLHCLSARSKRRWLSREASLDGAQPRRMRYSTSPRRMRYSTSSIACRG
jgi:hypothetical protein